MAIMFSSDYVFQMVSKITGSEILTAILFLLLIAILLFVLRANIYTIISIVGVTSLGLLSFALPSWAAFTVFGVLGAAMLYFFWRKIIG
jgi:hypothetical protein